MEKGQRRYENLDGLRTICCFAIIAMHIRANTTYDITTGDYLYNTIIPSWTEFVFLFLMISGFGMCCGYYERFMSGSISLTKFYVRRYAKILPFFTVLILIDILLERSLDSVYEGFIEFTLIFGLLPNNELSVIGVSWTLGVIFLFYMLFPFFVFLLHNKKFAWVSLVISLIITSLCQVYFFTDIFVVDGFISRHSFIYCIPFFLSGGIIYLYRDKIEEYVHRYRYISLVICILLTVLYYVVPSSINGFDIEIFKLLIVFCPWLCLLISWRTPILDNKAMHYLGGISLELYLAQMLSFRAVEMLGLLYVFGNGWIGYIITFVIVSALLVLFVVVVKKLLDVGNKFIHKRFMKPVVKN